MVLEPCQREEKLTNAEQGSTSRELEVQDLKVQKVEMKVQECCAMQAWDSCEEAVREGARGAAGATGPDTVSPRA